MKINQNQREWFKKVHTLETITDAVDHFLNEISRHLKSSGIIYFKYTPAYHMFVASRKVNINIDIQNLGVSLLGQEENSKVDALRNPEGFKEFNDFVHQTCSVQKYSALHLESNGDVKGLFLFLEHEEIEKDPYTSLCLNFLSLKISQIDTNRKLHDLTVYDTGTHVLNRRHFLRRLTEEVYRGKRTNFSVCLIIVSIDYFDQYVEDMPKEKVDMLLKMLALIMRKNSRFNDIIGRMGAEEFGIILPHTIAKGAITHAERLRSIVGSADFSKVVPRLNKVTMSFGISEYPTLCRDMDGLLESADQALSLSNQTEGNRVFLARAPDGFIPDYMVTDSPLGNC